MWVEHRALGHSINRSQWTDPINLARLSPIWEIQSPPKVLEPQGHCFFAVHWRHLNLGQEMNMRYTKSRIYSLHCSSGTTVLLPSSRLLLLDTYLKLFQLLTHKYFKKLNQNRHLGGKPIITFKLKFKQKLLWTMYGSCLWNVKCMQTMHLCKMISCNLLRNPGFLVFRQHVRQICSKSSFHTSILKGIQP